MGVYSKDPNEVPWDRSNPTVPFIDNVMQGTTFSWSKNAEWRPVPLRFKSPMVITGYEHGNSSITVLMKSPVTGWTYRVMCASLFKILEHSQCIKDEIPEHEWQFSKQGGTFVLKLVDY